MTTFDLIQEFPGMTLELYERKVSIEFNCKKENSNLTSKRIGHSAVGICLSSHVAEISLILNNPHFNHRLFLILLNAEC